MKIIIFILINITNLYSKDLSINDLYKKIVIIKSHYVNSAESWQDTPKGFEGNKIIRVCNLFMDEIMDNEEIDSIILERYLSSLNTLIINYQINNNNINLKNIGNDNVVFNYFSSS